MIPLPEGWALAGESLTHTETLPGFVEALAFVQEVGALAEAADHHPDIDLRYNRVHLRLCTHSAGQKVTAKDHDLAGKINTLSRDRVQRRAVQLRESFAS